MTPRSAMNSSSTVVPMCRQALRTGLSVVGTTTAKVPDRHSPGALALPGLLELLALLALLGLLALLALLGLLGLLVLLALLVLLGLLVLLIGVEVDADVQPASAAAARTPPAIATSPSRPRSR